MMRWIKFIWIAVTLLGCSTQKTNEAITEDKSNIPLKPFLPECDSLSYIGFIQKFDETGEFFTDILLFDSDNWSFVQSLADSVIYQDYAPFTLRKRIPIDKTHSLFNLTGLNKINIYDSTHSRVSVGDFTRIESYENSISGQIVAVFQVENPKIKDFQYCIGNVNHPLDSIEYMLYQNVEFEKVIQEYLKKDPEKYWRSKHFQSRNKNSIISFASVDTLSYIVETGESDLNVLYKSKWNEIFSKIILIPININGKPIILVNAGYYQSDISWNQLMVFDGEKYTISKTNRLALAH